MKNRTTEQIFQEYFKKINDITYLNKSKIIKNYSNEVIYENYYHLNKLLVNIHFYCNINAKELKLIQKACINRLLCHCVTCKQNKFYALGIKRFKKYHYVLGFDFKSFCDYALLTSII